MSPPLFSACRGAVDSEALTLLAKQSSAGKSEAVSEAHLTRTTHLHSMATELAALCFCSLPPCQLSPSLGPIQRIQVKIRAKLDIRQLRRVFFFTPRYPSVWLLLMLSFRSTNPESA